MIIALAGNQNCGKTTLFNRLTGGHQHVGNWPGVTVEKKSGRLLRKWLPEGGEPIEIVDLPGVYSLSPFSQEEEITRHCLTQNALDLIVNVVDATHLERNLYLTLQLLALGRPLVVALNLMDRLQASGGRIDIALLSRRLGVPVVTICARTGVGIPALVQAAVEKQSPVFRADDGILCTGPAKSALLELSDSIRQNPALQHTLQIAGFPEDTRAAAAMLMESGTAGLQRLSAHSSEVNFSPLLRTLRSLEARTGLSSAAALAAGRYCWLERLVTACCTQREHAQRTIQWDGLLVRSSWAIPVVAMVLCGVFYTAFGRPGQALTDAFASLLQTGIQLVAKLLEKWHAAPGLQYLLVDGLLPGVCSVLGFLPPLMLLMFLLNLLEESGYLARVVFLMDRPLRVMGLSGRSLIPFLMGFGCTVPAVMSARSMRSQRERLLTVLLTPLMSCGAKLPVYLLLTRFFFPNRQLLVIAALYLLGILTAATAGWLMNRTAAARPTEPFLLELPAYRLPSLRNALREVWHRGCEFLSRVFTVILLATLAVWLLSRYTFALKPAMDLKESMLGVTAGWLSPVFQLCGFAHPAATAALLTGLLAKENIVSTLMVLVAMPETAGAAGMALHRVFPNSLSAFAFLVFVLLYPPCAAATAALARETGNRRIAIAAYAGHLLLAWLASMLVYQLGNLFF
ncbi:MAG: ferrous iron transport protein B [Clostridiales bacterium]|nr:ferrous iron transport protein B [Clostridiales bacterium]